VAQEPKQNIAIPELDSAAGAAQMELSTEKYDDGRLVSAAHLHFVKDGSLTFRVYGDFRKVLLRTLARATQKNLNTQHASVFTPAAIDALKAEALAFYAEKRKKQNAI
jgi:hypothetical protein